MTWGAAATGGGVSNTTGEAVGADDCAGIEAVCGAVNGADTAAGAAEASIRELSLALGLALGLVLGLISGLFFSAVPAGGLKASKRSSTMVSAAYSSGARPSSVRPCRHRL